MSDKGQHALLTYAVFLTGAILLRGFLGISGIIWGAIAAAIWSFGKEAVDEINGKKWDWWDLIADGAGLVPAWLLIAGPKWGFIWVGSMIVMALIVIDTRWKA